MAKASKKLESLSFEEILSRLEEVVEKLEVGDAPLADALSTFETGVGLSRLGTARLDEAERRIEVLLAEGEAAQNPDQDDAQAGSAEGTRNRATKTRTVKTRQLLDKEPAFDE